MNITTVFLKHMYQILTVNGKRPAEAYCFLNCRTPYSGDAR